MKVLNLKCAVTILAIILSQFALSVKAQTVSTYFSSLLNNTAGIAFDKSGNLYVANKDIKGNGIISKITNSGTVSQFASSGLNQPTALAFDSSGNLFATDLGDNTIKKITDNGVVSIFSSGLNQPTALAFDANNNLYLGSDGIISKVSSTGVVSYFAAGPTAPKSIAIDPFGNLFVVGGGGTSNVSKITNNGIGTSFVDSGLYLPTALAFDASGNLYIANSGNNTISKVTQSGNLSTFASFHLYYPSAIAFDADGNLFVANQDNSINKIASNGVVSSFIKSYIFFPTGIAFDALNNLYITNSYNVSEVTKNKVASVFVDSSFNCAGMQFDKSGNLYISDNGSNSINKINPNGIVSVFDSLGFITPGSLAFDTAGSLYFSIYNQINDSGSIIKVTNTGIVSTFISNVNGLITSDKKGNLYVLNGESIYKISSDSIVTTIVDTAKFKQAKGLAVDTLGNLYVLNQGGNNTISKITSNGVVSTFLDTVLSYPTALAFDNSDNLYISDAIKNSIIKITNINPLPVTLSSFTASEINKTIQTNWHTATELNTSHFIIQHSTDGSSFTNIGTVKAIGSGANSYSFTDTHPANGINYYRLESVDKDGSSSYSKVVSVQLTVDRLPFTVVPNPARDFVTVKGSHIASVQMIDNMGRVVKVVTLKDATNPSLSVSSLAAGVYHLRIQTRDGNVSGNQLIIYN